MHNIYDRLLSEIPANARVTDFCCGAGRCYTQTRENTGFATMWNDWRFPARSSPNEGSTLREIADLIGSWNMTEASLGLSAINCHYNAQSIPSRETAETLGKLCEGLMDKSVLFVGHVPILESRLDSLADISFVSRHTIFEGDYAPSAIDYVMEKTDCVICSDLCVIDKSLERIIKIAKGEKIIVCGAEAPLAAALLEFGVSAVISLTHESESEARREVRYGLSSIPVRSYASAIHGTEYLNCEKTMSRCKYIGTL